MYFVPEIYGGHNIGHLVDLEDIDIWQDIYGLFVYKHNCKFVQQTFSRFLCDWYKIQQNVIYIKSRGDFYELSHVRL